ncbi:MAG: ComF family protein [Firmicutes bacterium]|nr:ComF family protein [Bacillota bacterium]
MVRQLLNYYNKIARLLYPDNAVCVACGALRVDDPARHLCRACAEKLIPLEPPFCPRCGAPGWAMMCQACWAFPPDDLDGRVSAYHYEGTARLLVRALKYTNVEPAAKALAMGMKTVLPPERYDALVPVPLYWRRERQRGFNQARILCQALSPAIGLPLLDALDRVRPTKTQTRLTHEERSENVKGAFVVRAAVKGQSLILVDDVMSTGATAVTCASALKKAGAASVLLLAAARTQKHMDG